MSAIHLRQIKAYLTSTFENLINMSDYSAKPESERESAFLSRSLAAFAIMNLADIEADIAAQHVTDGPRDNGLDAIYFENNERILYLVQSKWSHDGSSTINRGDAQKFIKGFRDLISPRFARFNEKVQALQSAINDAISDARTRIILLIVYSGQQPLSEDVRRDFDDVLKEMNDPTEIVSVRTLRQINLYSTISQGAKGTPINIDVALYEWGQTKEPYLAYYGQVSASDVAGWWDQYYPKLFLPNIRMFLGDTDVNEAILNTIRTTPENFWFFNNGITVLCAGIAKKAIGGSSRDMGVFECRDVRIVNGAQTVGSIADAAVSHPEQVGKARVPIRLISLENCPEGFDRDITRSNNTQNQIGRRDFVALDPEQERIKNELQLEGIFYIYKSGEVIPSGQQGFDLVDATVARACAQNDISFTTQAKREIGKLWEDIKKAPYKVLFNSSVSGLNLWKHVQVLRVVDSALSIQQSTLDGRNRMYAIHGNRFVAHMIFRNHPVELDAEYSELREEEKSTTKSEVEFTLSRLSEVGDELYPDSYLASLFKNQTKCREMEERLL